MLYTQTDREQATAELKKRRIIVLVPTILIALAAVGSFIWFRFNRDAGGWTWTGLITIVAGSYFLFFNGVYLHPVSIYKRHVDFMLDGRKRETTGVLKLIGTEVLDKDGMDCRLVTITVGVKAGTEDDRSFYLDALKPVPTLPVGSQVRVLSNDRMIAALEPAGEEK